ncbi:slipin family protein [Candidatus Micrarchaeota archaeon]|nr:slipin family protein [Candidatus Micrarchaeota archaeon]
MDICFGLFGTLIPVIFLLILLFVFILPIIWVFLPIVIIREWEGGLVLRLGKFNKSLKKGINIVIPFIDKAIKLDKRIVTIDIPKQEVMTSDNVPVKIDAVVYFKVVSAEKAVLNVKDYYSAVALYSQTAIRDVVGGVTLDTVLQDREDVAKKIREIVEDDMNKWGIDIVSINLQDVELPTEMKRAMARQAEAEREKRAVIIKASGELEASKNLVKASEILASNYSAINLRTLAFISDVSGDSAATFNFVIPLDNLSVLDLKKKGKVK